MSKSYDKVLAKLKKIDERLSAYEFDNNQFVHVREIDGEGEILLRSALVMRYDDWYLVFSEHHGPMAFHEDEVEWISVYRLVHDDIPGVDEFEHLKKQEHK